MIHLFQTSLRMLQCRMPLFLLAAAVGMLFGVPSSFAAAQSTHPTLTFNGDPVVADDQITLQFSVRQAGGLGVGQMTAANFSLSEPAADLTVSSEQSLPVALVVIVNLSYGSDVDLIRDTLRAYFSTYYLPQDLVSFVVLGKNGLEVTQPGNLQDINALIDGMTASNNYPSISTALTESLTWLRETADPQRPRLALYVGSFLNDPAEADASRAFALEQIPFNVVQAHRFRQPSTSAYRALANNGGGLFANNLDGSSVLKETPITAINTLKVLYDAIAATRTVYTLHYRTTSTDLSPQRQITLTAHLSTDEQISNTFTYTRQFMPPQVQLATANLNPLRQPSRVGDGIAFDLAEQPLAIAVTFPDGVVKKIVSLRLETTNASTGNLIQSRLELNPQTDASGHYLIMWPLTDFSTPASSTAIQLKLTVVDELGMAASTSADASVIVAALPATPTPPPTLTVEATLEPTVTLISANPVSTIAPPQQPLGDARFQNTLYNILVGIILVLVLVTILLLMVLRRTQNKHRADLLQAMATPAPQPPAAPVLAKTEQSLIAAAPAKKAEPETEPEKQILGRLIVVNGLAEDTIYINETEFVIGRSAESGCHYVISQPYISPRHCLFTSHGDKFLVRDLGSKNGTFVNGERIPRDRDVMVPIGSEVGITQNITTELWDPFTVVNMTGKRGNTQAETHHTQVTGDELIFRPLFGIKYSDDDAEISDDYSPV